VVDESALAKIAPCLTAIGHIHFATTVATTQKTGEEQLPVPHRSFGDTLPLPVALLAITRWFLSNSAQEI
jgi:hypothetical protein